MSTIKCSNCGKDIESSKMFLHERCCSLNVRKCSICDEPVQIDEYNEHKIVVHPDIKCEFCGNIFPNIEYNSHLKICSKKLWECKYCGLYMNKNELKEHEYQCGSKSIICEFCKENVPKMEYDLHLEYSCKKIDKKNKNNLTDENRTNNSPKSKNIKNFSDNISSKKITDDNTYKAQKINIINNKKDDDIINAIISGNKNKKNKISSRKRKRESDDDSYEDNTKKKVKTKSIAKKKKKYY